jgi:DNA-binding CsgD family transcriptional regulator
MPNSFRREKDLLLHYENKILAVFSGRKSAKEIVSLLNVNIDTANLLEGLAKELSRSVHQSISPSVHQSISPSELTPRQREILGLIAKGMTSKEIAASLHISVKTVESHRKQIMERLNVRNFASLILVGVRLGLISLDE